MTMASRLCDVDDDVDDDDDVVVRRRGAHATRSRAPVARVARVVDVVVVVDVGARERRVLTQPSSPFVDATRAARRGSTQRGADSARGFSARGVL